MGRRMTDTYRIRPEETWALAREDYLAGETTEEVCRRYDLGLRTLRPRARQENWRRIDQPHTPLDPDDLTIFDEYENTDMLEMARLRTVAAISRGNAGEAGRWRRLYEFWRDDVREINRLLAEEMAHEARQRARQASRS